VSDTVPLGNRRWPANCADLRVMSPHQSVAGIENYTRRMPRAKREFESGGTYHIVSRGSNRSAVYRSDTDRSAFLHLVMRVVRRYGIAWVAYCLMPNHYHAIVSTPDERLSDAMRDLNGGYSRRCSAMYTRDAHLFRNRFHARRITDLEHLLTAVCYVELNPVRANLCAHPAEWYWSSHRAVMGLDQSLPFLSPEIFLSSLDTDVTVARAKYAHLVEDAIERHRV
jgi:REP-associated tyrosine transposase